MSGLETSFWAADRFGKELVGEFELFRAPKGFPGALVEGQIFQHARG